MAEDFFRIYRGLELDESTQILQGVGVPGAAGDTSLAPVGSQYMNTTDGTFWTKTAVGVGTSKWEQTATKNYVDSQLGTTVSWREPAVVRDNTLTALPAGTVDVVDGHTLVDGDRVLFSAISGGGGPNVYIATGSTGAWTWTEDANQETSGDTLYIESGTSAGKTFTFNGTTWVQSDQTSVDELGYIRSFIGKNAAGAETPNYTSVTQVTQNGSLEQAIGELDAAIGADVTNGTVVLATNATNANIQALDTYIGAIALEKTASSVTTAVVLDGPIVTTAAKWIVRAVDAADPTSVYSAEVFATHNGVAVDNTKYAVLKLGTSINGLTFTVTLTGGNALNLGVSSTTAVNVVSRRVTVL